MLNIVSYVRWSRRKEDKVKSYFFVFFQLWLNWFMARIENVYGIQFNDVKMQLENGYGSKQWDHFDLAIIQRFAHYE